MPVRRCAASENSSAHCSRSARSARSLRTRCGSVVRTTSRSLACTSPGCWTLPRSTRRCPPSRQRCDRSVRARTGASASLSTLRRWPRSIPGWRTSPVCAGSSIPPESSATPSWSASESRVRSLEPIDLVQESYKLAPMPGSPLVLGVDSSTQSTKALLVDATDGTVIEERRASHPAGTAVDPTAWLAAFDEAAAPLLPRAHAMAIGGQQHGMVALDAHGKPVHEALLWNDVRSAPEAETLVEELGGAERCAELTGS